MAFVKNIKRPTDHELLGIIEDGVTPTEIAKSIPCSIDSIRRRLRRLGCTHDRKGSWFLPNAVPEKQRPRCRPVVEAKTEICKGVLPQQFPFIRTHIKIMDDGSRITLPDLSILAATRAERDRRERLVTTAFNSTRLHTWETQNAKG